MNLGNRIELIRFRDRETFLRFSRSAISAIRSTIETALLQLPLPRFLLGYCSVCRNYVGLEFSALHSSIKSNGSLALGTAETGVCPNCRISSRMRAAFEILETLNLNANSKIYLTEQTTFLFAAAKKNFSDLLGSEFLGQDKTSGLKYDGVLHQDLHDLSFADDTFDFVVCLDVLEHVNEPAKALAEIQRVLKPGGKAVVTFPFYWDRQSTVRRSRIGSSGEIEHILAPEYHGNPLGGGSLVFNEFSWDFLTEATNSTKGKLSFVNYWSLYSAHFGLDRFALILEGT